MTAVGALTTRVVSSLVLAPAVLAAFWFGGFWLAALLGLALALGAVEWQHLVRSPTPLYFLAGILGAALALAASAQSAAALAILALGAVAIWFVDMRRGGNPFPAALGPVYLGAPAVALLWLRAEPEGGAALALGLLVVVWAADIGAYAVGRTVGGARLAPRISPGKTWAGAVGGGALAAAMGAAFAAAWGVGLLAGALAGGMLAVAAQAGDLFESWLKRRRGVKDSGRAIPGHGGVLDRVDSLLGAAPALAAFVALGGWE